MKLSGFVGSSMADPVFNITGFTRGSEVMGLTSKGVHFPGTFQHLLVVKLYVCRKKL